MYNITDGIQCLLQDLSRKLKTAFELKRRWLREVEAEVNSLLENNETK